MNQSPGNRVSIDPRVVFNGRAGEYFRIWIVNIALSLLTLGVYSAWAKVRTRQYFYASTRVGGAAFDYLARPTQILEGRLIAVAALVIYGVVSETVPASQPWLMLALLPLVPWVIVKATAFNARNTAHRGLRFDFHGRYLGAFLGYLLLPALGVLSLGLLLPVAAWYRAHYLVSNNAYGATRFTQTQPLRAFYGAYARAALLLLALMVPAASGMATFYGHGLLAELFVVLGQLEHPRARTGTAPNDDPSDPSAGTGGIEQNGELLPRLSDENMTRVKRLFVALVVNASLMLAVIGAAWIYLRTALLNLTWNGTWLGPLAFDMRLRFGHMLWLKTSNLLAIVLSLGLAVPWARIRNARYLTSCLQVTGLAQAGALTGAAGSSGNVIGEELGDVFELNLGL